MTALADAKAIFFDMDNTLYDFERSMEHAFMDVREGFPDLARFTVQELGTAYWAHYTSVPEAEKVHLIDNDPDTYRRRMWAGCLAALGCDSSLDGLALKVTRHVEARRPIHWYGAMYPGAEAALRHLKGRHTIGVITNGPANVQRPKLRGLRYQDHFEEPLVFVSGEFGVRKPDASIFHAAAKAAGVHPTECVMVGDAREFDMPAKAVGFRTVLFDGKMLKPDCSNDPYPPDHVVRGYDELLRLFA